MVKKDNSHFGSCGSLAPDMEAKVVDVATGKSLPPNEVGELWVRGPNIMQGYLEKPEETAATLDKEGWLHTGDVVYFDNEGSLYIVDRIKELIKCKGFQVAPAELEGLLLTHPEIMDAAVVPLPDDEAGEVPTAYVVRAAGSNLSSSEVIAFIHKQVVFYKRLRQVTFIPAIPKSASGKILRRELKAQRTAKL
jgi:4-coumarate--CoA ligase